MSTSIMASATVAAVPLRVAGERVSSAAAERLERVRGELSTRDDVAPVVVFIVAVAVLLALSVVMSTAVVLYCISKGYRRVSWFGPNGWKVWQMKVACTR